MKQKFSIFAAMIAFLMLVSVAAAESPDAGSTWSTAKSFSMSNGYNYINGQLTQNNPTDQDDWWKSSSVSVGNYLEIFLNSAAYNNYVRASMYDNQHDEMQRVYIGGGGPASPDTSLDSTPVRVYIKGNNLVTQAYTFTVYKA